MYLSQLLSLIAPFALVLTFAASEGCSVGSSDLNANKPPVPSPTPSSSTAVQADPPANANVTTEGKADDREIRSCQPEKLYKGDTLKIEFAAVHGRNLAIFNEKTRDFYFLTENAGEPSMLPDEFAKLRSVELEVSKVRNFVQQNDVGDERRSTPFFTKTGWYRVIIGHQALDVDFESMPISGMCRVHYTDSSRPAAQP